MHRVFCLKVNVFITFYHKYINGPRGRGGGVSFKNYGSAYRKFLKNILKGTGVPFDGRGSN